MLPLVGPQPRKVLAERFDGIAIAGPEGLCLLGDFDLLELLS